MQRRVYIHIPFCKYICSYCDFCKKYINYHDVDEYIDYLIREFDLYLDGQRACVDSIYIGGGTPSALLNLQVEKLMDSIAKRFVFLENYEFTFECNPDDVTEDLLKVLKRGGVNRLSIGCQSFDNLRLKAVGRGHSSQDIILAVKLAREYFNNVSVDLMFDFKGETLKDVSANLSSISEICEYIDHVSYYGLIVEKNVIDDYYATVSAIESDNNQSVARKKYEMIILELDKIGFVQYEISNFAKDGFESQHNLGYWLQEEYFGFGLSASGYLNKVRYSNKVNLKSYYEAIRLGVKPVAEVDEVLEFDMVYEKIMLNLRTVRGIEKEFLVRYKIEVDLEFFEEVGGYIKIRQDYLFISNELIIKCLEQLEEKYYD